MKEANPHLGVGPSHPPAIADDVHNPPIVRVDHLFDLDVVSVERLPVLAHGFLCRFKSQDFDDIRPELRVVELVVRVEQLPGYLQAGVDPFIDPANRLDVPLRHRPRSISRAADSGLTSSAHAIDSVHAEPVVLAEEAHHRVAPRTAEADLVGIRRAGADQSLDVDGLAGDHAPEGLLVGAAEGPVDLAVAPPRRSGNAIAK